MQVFKLSCVPYSKMLHFLSCSSIISFPITKSHSFFSFALFVLTFPISSCVYSFNSLQVSLHFPNYGQLIFKSWSWMASYCLKDNNHIICSKTVC